MSLGVVLLALLCLATQVAAPSQGSAPAPATPSPADAAPASPTDAPIEAAGQAEAAPGSGDASPPSAQGSPLAPTPPELIPAPGPGAIAQAERPVRPPAAVAFTLRYSHRRPHAGEEDLPGPAGFGVGLLLQGRYLSLTERLELGLALDFGFDRWSRAVSTGPTTGGSGPPAATDDHLRQLTHTNFALLHPVTLHLGPLEVMGALGLGLDVDYFATGEPALSPGETRGTYLALRGAASIAWKVTSGAALGIRADYASLPTAPTATLGGAAYHVFTPRFGLGLTFLYRP